MNEDKVILCAANAYEKKYYFNEKFSMIPESIQEELHVICVLFTEEVGGVFSIGFDEDGSLYLLTNADEEDLLYDEIGAGLLVKEVQKSRVELFESLELFYKTFVECDMSAISKLDMEE